MLHALIDNRLFSIKLLLPRHFLLLFIEHKAFNDRDTMGLEGLVTGGNIALFYI